MMATAGRAEGSTEAITRAEEGDAAAKEKVRFD
jgi:hypothetical protein